MNLNEVRVLTTLHLSETQKIVMARVANAPNPHVAYENVNAGQNLVTAAKELDKLGMIHFMGGQAEISEEGQNVMQNENLTDESGALTEEGQRYAEMKGPSEKGKEAQPPQPTEQSTEPPMGEEPPMGGEEDMGMQMNSFDLLRSMEDQLILKEQLANLGQN